MADDFSSNAALEKLDGNAELPQVRYTDFQHHASPPHSSNYRTNLTSIKLLSLQSQSCCLH